MSELSTRRNNLFNALKDNSAVIIHSGVSKITSEDEFFPFVCNKDFFYLTGIKQENSTLVLIKANNQNRVFLFVEPYSELKEKWTGKRLTLDEAKAISDIPDTFDNTVLDTKIDLILAKNSTTYGEISTLYLDIIPELKIADETCEKHYSTNIKAKYDHLEIVNVHEEIVKLRLIKSTEEIENMKAAINLTSHGINEVLHFMKPDVFEYQMACTFFNYGYMNGKTRLAFDTIIAGGKNATCLHYPQQLDRLKKNDLVLFDLGYSYNGYSADVSRTYPISGKFNDIQRNIYEAVLLCNKAVIAYAREGLTIRDLQEYTIKFYLNELPKRGLMPKIDNVEEARKELFKVYYHGVSHYLGLDTHDVCVSRDVPLEPGNVITVEPGLYFKDYGIGVRIEDDVLITKDGNEVLTSSIKKEIKDIEAMLKDKH